MDALLDAIQQFQRLVKQSRRKRFSIVSHHFYAPKAQSSLAELRKQFLLTKRNYPEEKYPMVAFQIVTLEPLVNKLIEVFPSDAAEMDKLLTEISFKIRSDVSAAIESSKTKSSNLQSSFLPNDLISDSFQVLKQVLWEVNKTYEEACYNSCAAMIRRLFESVIIDVYVRLNMQSKIMDGDDYLRFQGLIGIASSDIRLGLTRNTKKLLPDLKFLGDLGTHNRNALVRATDLDRVRNAIRVGLEELVGKL